MARSTARAAIVAAVLSLHTVGVLAQTPLIQQRYSWPYSGPYKIDTSNGPRGIMTGINRCNSSTATQDSLCVNAVANSIQDFCVFAPPEPNSIIANVEGECVAWCVNGQKYGTRTIPSGAVTGMQVVKTPGYLAFALNINGPLLYIQASDSGGELDPHGADARGNPIGSLMYTNAFGGSTSGETQAQEWHEFLSGTQICMKVCNPSQATDSRQNLCDNIYDTVGCNANVPLNYGAIGTTFQSCLGDNQLPPAQNVQALSNGGTIFTPSTSQCSTFASSAIFTVSVSASGVSSSASASASGSSSASGSMITSAASASSGAATMSSAGVSTTSRTGAAAPFRTAAPVALVAAAAFAYVAA